MRRRRTETSEGMWVRTKRQQLGWSQHRLAANIDLPEGIHSGRIAEIENGQRPLRPEWREQMEHIFAQHT